MSSTFTQKIPGSNMILKIEIQLILDRDSIEKQNIDPEEKSKKKKNKDVIVQNKSHSSQAIQDRDSIEKQKIDPKEKSKNNEDVLAQSKSHSPEVIKILKDWILLHLENPYASKEVKIMLAKSAGLNIQQVNTWLKHTRRSIWFRNRVKERYSQESKSKDIPIYVRNLLKNIE